MPQRRQCLHPTIDIDSFRMKAFRSGKWLHRLDCMSGKRCIEIAFALVQTSAIIEAERSSQRSVVRSSLAISRLRSSFQISSMFHILRVFFYAICVLSGIGVLLTITALKFAPGPVDQRYATSIACRDCHRFESQGWAESSHAKMMRRIDGAGGVSTALLASKRSPPFHPDDAVWVIGSKWAHQFMGEDDKGETLLPGEWHIQNEKWETTGWDGWELPNPLQRCHGCHTVGLDVSTGMFAEAGIGCEACHGPHGWHVDTFGLATGSSLLAADVCGRCHSRGRSSDGAYFFAHDYKPGDDLSEMFVEDEPDFVQNSANWWGTGSERSRHQEYTAWKRGGHADSLRSLRVDYDGRYGEVTSECMKCHSAEGAIAKTSVDVSENLSPVTCAACHFSHGEPGGARSSCESCHDQGPFHHRQVAEADHAPCPVGAVDCIDCHMPKTALLAGEVRLHSHAPGVTRPMEGEKFGAPTSCANGGCHTDRTTNWLQERFDNHYRSSTFAASTQQP